MKLLIIQFFYLWKMLSLFPLSNDQYFQVSLNLFLHLSLFCSTIKIFHHQTQSEMICSPLDHCIILLYNQKYHKCFYLPVIAFTSRLTVISPGRLWLKVLTWKLLELSVISWLWSSCLQQTGLWWHWHWHWYFDRIHAT